MKKEGFDKYIGKKIVDIEARVRHDGEVTCLVFFFEDGARLDLYCSHSGDTIFVVEHN